MPTNRSSGAKKSKGRTDSTDARNKPPQDPPRAKRDDTTETQQQRAGTPKTHPTRAPVASRKSPGQT